MSEVSEKVNIDFLWIVFESMINLMEEARLEGDTKKLNTYARLVHEGWIEIVNAEDE